VNSGTLITARQGMEQNRSVMVIPGRIDSKASQGCHTLLKQGACLVTSPEEVIEEVQDLFIGKSARLSTAVAQSTQKVVEKEARPAPVLMAEERSVLANLEDDGVLIDVLIRKTGLPAGRVNALLVSLQIKRLVKLMPGGTVRRAS